MQEENNILLSKNRHLTERIDVLTNSAKELNEDVTRSTMLNDSLTHQINQMHKKVCLIICVCLNVSV